MTAAGEEFIAGVWAKLAIAWPLAWRSAMAPNQETAWMHQREWLDSIRGEKLGKTQVAKALEKCHRGRRKCNRFPPSLPEFLELARGPVDETAMGHASFRPASEVMAEQSGAKAHLQLPLGEEAKARRKRVGREHLAAMRASLDGL
jgi:hypothetical protein